MRRLALLLLFVILAFLSYYSYKQYRGSIQEQASEKTLQRNVYLITASGLRAEHLSSYLYQPIQTPAMDFLAYDGVRFLNAFTPSTESLTAHISLLTGLDPVREPIRQTSDYLHDVARRGLPENLQTLPEILTRKGYRTAAFLSDPELRFPAFFGDLFHQAYAGDETLYPWQSAYSPTAVCKLARDWIKQNRTLPHFLLLNFDEPTFPFEPPVPFNRQYSKHPYDGEIAGLDEQIGLFVSALKETGLFQKSIVVLTSPYGETLSDSSRYASPTNPVLHVPVLITAPGLLPRKETYDAQISLVDLMPTVLGLLEYEKPAVSDGFSLFQKGKREQIARESVLGMVPFSRLFGFPNEYFARTDRFVYARGLEETVHPHRSSAISEEQKAVWLGEGRKLLKADAVRWQEQLPENVETVPSLLLEKVIDLARQERPEVALDLLKLFSAPMPQTAYVESLAGMLAFAAGDQVEALSSLRKAAELAPSVRTLPMLASVAVAGGHTEEAMSALKRYRSLSQRMSYDVRSTYAIVLQQMNREQEALLEFDTVLRQNPRYTEARLHRGKVLIKLGRMDDAERDFKVAIQTKPNFMPAYRELASLLEKRGKPADAMPYLRQVLRLEPQDYEAMLQLAGLHQKVGKISEARKLWEQVILHAEDPEIKNRAKSELTRSLQ